ncbi:PSD1 and planctomycete cytochrome C domain-containing protein [Rosistilla carotiformis]|uniref:PSD1 and planctomycete cytochrome C domain-containing protein n=1 Tax=Rosistilla carotiformis TaxID=2528017 RepID=UPI001E56831B|nr:PSD1 and planctomycete cytochrome C domain-containing protein [Rosistilla carotiformis]
MKTTRFPIEASVRRLVCLTVVGLFFSLFVSGGSGRAEADDAIGFSQAILPLLSDRCFHCHGPDEGTREADLRLDIEAGAKADLGGYRPITAGDLDASEVWQRIVSDDPDLVMPPPDSHRKPLTEGERAAIRQWIFEGAKWGKHWSFEPPQRGQVPTSAAHPIDAFVRDLLQREGLQPSPRAAAATQIRRLAFSLTGMSPDAAVMDAFVDSPSDEAWQEAVDRMLESPQHAERMAMWWLDAARYSDSDGFQIDATRQNWPWRDWVIDAFQKNMPFDRFTIEQFAGDLLPDATAEQILATCFHRNHMTNGEGGRDPEESRVDYVIDRVNTVGTVWLGLTLGCTQCHSHKFDPISHRDYYAVSAFFNSIDEDGKAGMGAKPYLEYTSPKAEQAVEELAEFVAKCETDEAAERAAAESRFQVWLQDQRRNALDPSAYQPWWVPESVQVSSSEGTVFEVDSEQVVVASGPDTPRDDYRIELEVPAGMRQVSGWKIEVLPDASHVDGRYTRFGTGDFTLTSVKLSGKRTSSPIEMELPLARATADFEPQKERKSVWDRRYANIAETLNDDARDGWTSEGADANQSRVGVYELTSPWEVQPGDRLVVVFQQRSTHGHANIGKFRIALASELGETVRRADGGSPMRDWLESLADATDSEKGETIPDDLRKRLLDQFLLSDYVYQEQHQRLQQARRQLKAVRGQTKPRKVMVLKDRETPRKTHVLQRGVWDAKGEEVSPGVLPSVFDWPQEDLATRLDLARWLVDSKNPLTARVIVNQMWQMMFGSGLVRTPDDFGLQGELPTHPRLLDWLAVELIEADWDLRHVLRLIATSETFRQSSVASASLRERDADNRLLSRYPRRRLPAWMLRDNALKVSGVLNSTVGGPPVYPYQPPGVWSEITMGRFDYDPSLGPAQYRRTLYSFWRRSVAPTFLFDSAQRRVCETGVRLTNTPLQALTLMNDQTMLEASRSLADLSGDAGQTEFAQQLAVRVLGRSLDESELVEVLRVYERTLQTFDRQPEAAARYVTVGQRPKVSPEAAPRVAAWMTVASLLMNLDEAISYE